MVPRIWLIGPETNIETTILELIAVYIKFLVYFVKAFAWAIKAGVVYGGKLNWFNKVSGYI
jgi:hypothetical protein